MNHLNARTSYEFMRGDFRAIWDSLAANAQVGSRGNFPLALLATQLLELTARTTYGQPHLGTAVARALETRDRRYFTPLPFSIQLAKASQFTLPALPSAPADQQLLAVVFDLIRNGQAHQGQQIIAALGGGTTFSVSLAGPRPGDSLNHLEARRGTSKHLSAYCGTRHIRVILNPGLFFLDLEAAVDSAKVFKRGSKLALFKRPGVSNKGGHYVASAASVRAALRAHGHREVKSDGSWR